MIEVYRMLQEEFGIDFTHYKPSTVTRRIERRLALARSADIDEYIRRLKSDRGELDVLYRDLLIGVTRFFRDEEAFQILENQVLPELLSAPAARRAAAPLGRRLRDGRGGLFAGHPAGRADGQAGRAAGQDLRDRRAPRLARARHAGHLRRGGARRRLAGAPGALLHQDRRRYQVVPELRQRIVFAQHNVIKDAPFTRVDLVSCRNLLIYLQPAAQQKVLSLFHFALNRGGVLFLGPSETAGALSTGFETLDKHWRIYRKRSDARIPRRRAAVRRRRWPAPPCLPFNPPGGRYSLSQLLATYDALLERTMPPSLLVNERGELVHAFGGAGAFLQHRDGRQGLDVLELVEPELKMVLVGGLKRALVEPAAIVYRDVRVSERDAERRLQGHDPAHRQPGRRSAPPPGLVRANGSDCAGQPHVRDRDGDRPGLAATSCGPSRPSSRHTKENLQAAIEELETSNEELQASNEELLTSNEELQSTNEELQSVNEELYTVNAEYQRKIGELTELTNDMDNLLSSTDIGTIFLDAELKIRKFTPQIAETFSLVPHDVGRTIETFAHQMEHPELVEDLQRVLRDRRSRSSASCATWTAKRSFCASCRTARRGRSTAWSSRSST